MKLERVAIVTPYGLTNYGNRLQNYALDLMVRRLGLEVETVVMGDRGSFPGYAVGVRDIAHRLRLKGPQSRRHSRFRQFDQAMAKYHVWTRGQLADLSSRYDVALIGSDQIWNPYQVKWGGLEYGSAFRTEQRVSVSASFGLDAAPDEYREYMAEHLSGMRKISVREVAGKEIVRDLVGREAEVLIDPTLALSRDDWSSVASTEYLPEGRHVLVYALGKLSDVNAASVASAASRNGAETVRLLDRSASRYYPTGPQDFIGLIMSSELVVTDSFHAVVFSLLFERDVVLIERQGKSYSMLSRFTSLCRLLGLEMVADDEFENAYRFVGVGEASLTDNLDAQRLKFRKYLADLLQPRYAE